MPVRKNEGMEMEIIPVRWKQNSKLTMHPSWRKQIPPSQIPKELSDEMTGPVAIICNIPTESEWFCMTGEY